MSLSIPTSCSLSVESSTSPLTRSHQLTMTVGLIYSLLTSNTPQKLTRQGHAPSYLLEQSRRIVRLPKIFIDQNQRKICKFSIDTAKVSPCNSMNLRGKYKKRKCGICGIVQRDVTLHFNLEVSLHVPRCFPNKSQQAMIIVEFRRSYYSGSGPPSASA